MKPHLPTPTQLDAIINEMRAALAHFATQYAPSVAHAKETQSIGYPTSSIPAHTSPDADGPGYSDRTGDLVATHRTTDPLMTHIVEAARGIANAQRLLRIADSHLWAATPTRDQPDRRRPNTVDICLACPDPAPNPRRGLCGKCYKHWTRSGRPELSCLKTDDGSAA